MAFIEVKATATATGALFPSKAAIRRAWEADPNSVTFQSVQGLGGHFYGPVLGPESLPDGLKLTVVGPDPEVLRNYYGTVEVYKGKIRIS